MTTSVRPHDFHHRETLERPYLLRLRHAFDEFARHATVECSTLLGKPVHLALRNAVEKSWQDLVALLDDRPYLASFTLDPYEGEAVLATTHDAVSRWIELRLGGGTGPLFASHPNLTETDFAVLAGITVPLLDLLGESLTVFKKVSPALRAQQASNQFVQMSGPGEMFLVATFELIVASDPPTEVVVALPIPLVQQFAGVVRSGTRPADSEDRAVDPAVVLQTPIHLWLELPAVELTPGEISELEVGNVIPFVHPLTQPLDVRAEGVLVARATQGHLGSKIVCCITEEVVEDER